jgi:hypothetical protein
MKHWAIIRTKYGTRWVECDGHGRPLDGVPLHRELPPAPGNYPADDAALALRVADAKSALGLAVPVEDPAMRPFDPERRARPVPPRVPPREPQDPAGVAARAERVRRALRGESDDDPELAERVERAKAALAADDREDDVAARAREVMAAMRGEQ